MSEEIGYVVVDTETLGTIARGLQEDTARLRGIAADVSTDLGELERYWQGKKHDDFVRDHGVSAQMLQWNYDSLSECVFALLDAWREYQALEQGLDDLAAGMWL